MNTKLKILLILSLVAVSFSNTHFTFLHEVKEETDEKKVDATAVEVQDLTAGNNVVKYNAAKVVYARIKIDQGFKSEGKILTFESKKNIVFTAATTEKDATASLTDEDFKDNTEVKRDDNSIFYNKAEKVIAFLAKISFNADAKEGDEVNVFVTDDVTTITDFTDKTISAAVNKSHAIKFKKFANVYKIMNFLYLYFPKNTNFSAITICNNTICNYDSLEKQRLASFKPNAQNTFFRARLNVSDIKEDSNVYILFESGTNVTNEVQIFQSNNTYGATTVPAGTDFNQNFSVALNVEENIYWVLNGLPAKYVVTADITLGKGKLYAVVKKADTKLDTAADYESAFSDAEAVNSYVTPEAQSIIIRLKPTEALTGYLNLLNLEQPTNANAVNPYVLTQLLNENTTVKSVSSQTNFKQIVRLVRNEDKDHKVQYGVKGEEKKDLEDPVVKDFSAVAENEFSKKDVKASTNPIVSVFTEGQYNVKDQYVKYDSEKNKSDTTMELTAAASQVFKVFQIPSGEKVNLEVMSDDDQLVAVSYKVVPGTYKTEDNLYANQSFSTITTANSRRYAYVPVYNAGGEDNYALVKINTTGANSKLKVKYYTGKHTSSSKYLTGLGLVLLVLAFIF